MDYINEEYSNAIEHYRNGSSVEIRSLLEKLTTLEIPDYNEEIIKLLTEIDYLAKQKNDLFVISSTAELSRKMNSNGANGMAHAAVLKQTLCTENDCLIALENSLNNDQYEAVLTSIIDFIVKQKKIHTALVVLRRLSSYTYKDSTSKKNIILYFIERMDIVIKKEIVVKPIFGSIFGYKSLGWGKYNFNSDEYIDYKDLRDKLERRYKK